MQQAVIWGGMLAVMGAVEINTCVVTTGKVAGVSRVDKYYLICAVVADQQVTGTDFANGCTSLRAHVVVFMVVASLTKWWNSTVYSEREMNVRDR